MSCIATVGRGRCDAQSEPGSLFCRTHEQAPAGRRGGWISAERRRRVMAGSKTESLDASNIVRRLWLGAKPPFDRQLPFDVLVLCAQELQPNSMPFAGRVLRPAIPDAPLSQGELNRVILSARAVATSLLAGRKVLVTCADGMGRSALVAGLGLGFCTNMGPDEVVDLIRRRRSDGCLRSPHFVDVLRRLIRR